MMHQLIAAQEVTSQDYPIQYLSSPSTSIDDLDATDFLLNILSNLIRKNIKRPYYLSLTSVLETDLSSIWPRFETKSEASLTGELPKEKILKEISEENIAIERQLSRELCLEF